MNARLCILSTLPFLVASATFRGEERSVLTVRSISLRGRSQHFLGNSNVSDATAVLVLGQSLNPDRSASDALIKRVGFARDLHTTSGGPLIVSGGDPAAVGITEAEVMRDLLLQSGVPQDSIFLEPGASNTVQNVIYACPILHTLKAQRLVLVTSDFHMPRSAYIAETVLKHLEGCPDVELDFAPAPGGCPQADALEGANINDWSCRQRIRGEMEAVSKQLPKKFLPTDLADVSIPSPSEQRIRRALQELQTMLEALKQDT
eukprot:TRINITY_DN38029_c0_g1_i1.p1 TRINITY_DN38029_c0_g1~~TRINITY_DN38029_c0_g1_i1.p1  ORF type:complete len:261 (+),score=31.11 TRINITY_DN38029_c0_g1_i1:71-853(+)